jgi:hypothetical protein
MLKPTKTVISLSVDPDDLEYIRDIGIKYNSKNLSGAFRILIERTKQFERQLQTLKDAMKASQKPTYEAVRNEQIQKSEIVHETPGLTANKGPYNDSKWAFLGKPEDQNLKSKIKIKKHEYSDDEKIEAVKRLKK